MRTEIFEKAQVIMQNRRRNAIVENDRRIDEVNEKIPEIRAINDELFNTGKKIIDIIRAGGADVQQKIERLKLENLGAQDYSRTLLTRNGFPPDYLNIHYNCEKCDDTGYYNSEMCECFKKLCGKLEADEINKRSQLELSSFDTFKLSYYTGTDYTDMKRIFDFTKSYAENFTCDSNNIIMYGKTGQGKTHLSLAIANKVLEKGYSVIYDSAVNILHEIEKEHFSYNAGSEMTDIVIQTDLLILDDLGTEYAKPFYTSAIYNIINTRFNRKKPTIISTNLPNAALKERYDARIISRIVTQYVNLSFCGKDVRWQKKNEKINHF